MRNDITRRITAEFFGTFWLVFGGCGSAVLAACGNSAKSRGELWSAAHQRSTTYAR